MASTWVSFGELSGLIGMDMATVLCRMQGGVDIHIPKMVTPQSPLARYVGYTALRALASVYGGTNIIVPNHRKDEPKKHQVLLMLAILRWSWPLLNVMYGMWRHAPGPVYDKPAFLIFKETLIYSAWRRCFTFFETVEDGRVHSCFKKRSRLAKRNNCAFPGGSLTSAFLIPLNNIRVRF